MKLSKFLIAMAIGLGLVLTPATAARATDAPPEKGFVCHATSSDTNPYVLLYVPLNSAHFDSEKHPEDIFHENTNRVPVCPGSEPEDGAQGPAGPAGPAGENGKDGINGTDGTDGTDGADGAQGPAGENGKDADLTRIEQLERIVTELNNRLFILEHAVPAEPTPTAETITEPAPDATPIGDLAEPVEELAFGGNGTTALAIGLGLVGVGLLAYGVRLLVSKR